MAADRRFWWVNQNQTFEQEFKGGYLWSPKRNQDGRKNHFYETMREVAPGDVIYSFRKRQIQAIGIAKSYGYDCPKPDEFGRVGQNWSNVGWKVDVGYQALQKIIVPKEHMGRIGPLLAPKYAPLQSNGNGIQSVYLTEISDRFGTLLAGLIGREAEVLVSGQLLMTKEETPEDDLRKGIGEWEDQIQDGIHRNSKITETEKTSLVKSRRGQGLFKERVRQFERKCRITGVQNMEHLIGSHIKPWRRSDNEERLDGENGLLLTPSIDHLFDRGFISFKGDGNLIISPRADQASLERMGVETNAELNVGKFTAKQSTFLEFHRDSILLKAS